jgi:hypothetical protein
MTVIGYICTIVAVAWIIYKVYVAYNSFGGTIGVSVYDAAMYPPIFGVFGLYWVLNSLTIDLALWIYLVIWLGVAGFIAIAIRVAEEMGDRRR